MTAADMVALAITTAVAFLALAGERISRNRAERAQHRAADRALLRLARHTTHREQS